MPEKSFAESLLDGLLEEVNTATDDEDTRRNMRSVAVVVADIMDYIKNRSVPFPTTFLALARCVDAVYRAGIDLAISEAHLRALRTAALSSMEFLIDDVSTFRSGFVDGTATKH
jgi:argininosuccinate lyase